MAVTNLRANNEFTSEQKNLIEEHFSNKEYDTDIILLALEEYDWGTIFVVETKTVFSPDMMFALNTFDGSCKRIDLECEAFEGYAEAAATT